MNFYGVDIHYDSFVAVKVSDSKKTITNVGKFYLDDKEGFATFIEGLSKEDHIAVEASSNSFWFHDAVKDHVKKCWVINPGRFRDIANTKKKTDKVDARKIAKKLKYTVIESGDEEDFPTVFVPSKEVRNLRSLFTTYELFSKQRTIMKNRIYSLFINEFGHDLSKELDLYKKGNREAILNMDMSLSLKFQLELLYGQLDMLESQLAGLKTGILKEGAVFKDEIDKLVGIKGVSVFTAIAIMTDIADIDRFLNAKKLCSYLRSAPSIEASNKTVKIGPVNKQSRKLALKMLLQGLPHAYKNSEYLLKFYERKKKGMKAGKVRIAIARKIFMAIYHMLTKNKDYYWKDVAGHERKMREYIKFLDKKNIKTS